MAMNKTEQAQMEQLKTLLALRHTAPVECDLPAPKIGDSAEIRGYLPGTVSLTYAWPRSAVSDGSRHGTSFSESQPRLSSHGSKAMHSTRLDALRATRHTLEQRAAEALRQIDLWIAEEEAKQ